MAMLNGLHHTATEEDVHAAIRWIYADAAERLADSGFVAGDVNKFAVDLDTGMISRLADDSPVTWIPTRGIQTTDVIFIIGDGVNELTPGVVGDLMIDFACDIDSVTLLADQTGSVVVDIWKDTYANFPPTDADSITASAPPTISTATKSQDSTLTGWTTAIAAGSILRLNVDSVTDITRVSLILKVSF